MRLLSTSFVFSIVLGSCISERKIEQREYLKGYTLCRCIEYGNSDSSNANRDPSLGVYRQLASYPIETFEMLDSLARETANNIKPLINAEYEGKKAIQFQCFKYVQSKKFKALIKALDKQAIKP